MQLIYEYPEKLVKVGSDEWIDHYVKESYLHDGDGNYYHRKEHEVLNTRNRNKSESWHDTQQVEFHKLPTVVQQLLRT